MKMRAAVLLTLATFATLSAASTAQAQISNPVKFTIFGGAALPVSDTQDFYKTGYTVGGALDFRVPLSPVGLRGEVVYSGLDVKDNLASDGKVSDFGANANVVLWLPNVGSPVTAYFTGGPSFSHLSFSEPAGSGSVSFSENHWGFNVGAGLQFALGGLGTRLDARYRRISAGDGDAFSIIPITFGITF
jgi:opacity protein-like surface antigen